MWIVIGVIDILLFLLFLYLGLGYATMYSFFGDSGDEETEAKRIKYLGIYALAVFIIASILSCLWLSFSFYALMLIAGVAVIFFAMIIGPSVKSSFLRRHADFFFLSACILLIVSAIGSIATFGRERIEYEASTVVESHPLTPIKDGYYFTLQGNTLAYCVEDSQPTVVNQNKLTVYCDDDNPRIETTVRRAYKWKTVHNVRKIVSKPNEDITETIIYAPANSVLILPKPD